MMFCFTFYILCRERSEDKQTYWPGRNVWKEHLNDILFFLLFFKPLDGNSHSLLAAPCNSRLL